jgi:hypothetical protein
MMISSAYFPHKHTWAAPDGVQVPPDNRFVISVLDVRLFMLPTQTVTTVLSRLNMDVKPIIKR